MTEKEQIKAIKEQMTKLDSDHKKNMEELKAKVEQLSKDDGVMTYIQDYFDGYDTRYSFSDIEEDVLGWDFKPDLCKTGEEYTRYLVEKIIEKVIEYYNEGWKKNLINTGYRFSYYSGFIKIFDNITVINTKFTLYMKSEEVAEKVKEKLTNWNGKNLIKYYFLGEF